MQLPERISGQWIFLERLKEKKKAVLLMRRQFHLEDDSHEESKLFISANTFYTLFVNGRLVGAGPRIHHTPGTSYIDVQDISLFLEPGNNMIAVCVSWNPDEERGDFSRTPGMWCQLQQGSQTLLESDSQWQLLPLENSPLPRMKCVPGGRENGSADLNTFPLNWNLPDDGSDHPWEAPDMFLLPGSDGGRLELHPLFPAEVKSHEFEFTTTAAGKVAATPGFSCFTAPAGQKGRICGAVSYIFSDEELTLRPRIYTHDAVRVFSGKRLVFQGKNACGEEVELPLVKGWNRLLVFTPVKSSPASVMFLASEWPGELLPLSDMLDSAALGWCVGSFDRIPFTECTPAVNVERLADLTGVPSGIKNIPGVRDWMENSQIALCACDDEEKTLGTSEMLLCELPEVHYGFVQAVFTASEGDIVDILIGGTPEEGTLLPARADGEEGNSFSFICREGENKIFTPVPLDCSALLFSVRHAGDHVTLQQLDFDELSRTFNRECSFRCSDEMFNRFWECGCASLARSSALLQAPEGLPRCDAYLLDSFWESVNIAAVYGDDIYITARLRQFAGTQLENGALTSLSSGEGYDSALFHMFFFSNWILFNYRFTCNQVEMRNLIPKLDAVKNYLLSLLDESTNLLDLSLLPPVGENEKDPVARCRLPVVMNALFCRFMMSASEVYDLVERASEARECRRYLRSVSKSIADTFFDSETMLFSDSPRIPGGKLEFSLLGNFFPLLTGINTAECFENFVKTFFDFEKALPLTAEAESPYFHCLFTEMLFALGQKEWGFKYFRNYWEKRLDPDRKIWLDPFYSLFNSTRFSGGTAIVPNVFLIREILGVRLAEPAHSVIYFDPAVELVDFAEAAIPTSLGRMHLKWEKLPDGGLEITIYSSHPVKVMPELSSELLKASTFRLSENVVLVKSAEKEDA